MVGFGRGMGPPDQFFQDKGRQPPMGLENLTPGVSL